MNPRQMIGEAFSVVRRRFWILAIISTLGVAGAVFYALIKPPLYETSAKILIEGQQIPDDLARSTVSSSAAERLQLIEQRLMARDNLIALMEKLDLFADADELPVTDKIDLLRQATRIDSTSYPGQGYGNREISSFTITVALGDAEQAATLANEFVSSVLEQNLRSRSERARETLDFFEKEETRIAEAITALETEITEFKTEHEDALPESLEFRYDELSRIQETTLELERQILGLEEERDGLQTVLEGGRPLTSSGDRDRETSPRSPEETELRRLQTELAQRRRVLAPDHPELRLLEGRVEALSELISTIATDSEVIRRLEVTTEAQRRAVRAQIGQLTTRIALLSDQKEVLDARSVELQTSIRETPGVEITLNAYNRRYNELQEQYSAITRKRAEAETGEKLEINQQSERFEVVENALVPRYPIEPNRKKIVVLGSAAGVALAVGLAMLLETLFPVIRRAAQMERRLDVRPVVAIPYVETPMERMRRMGGWATVALVVVAAVPIGAMMVDEQVMPLEEIWDYGLEKSGVGNLVEMAERRFGG